MRNPFYSILFVCALCFLAVSCKNDSKAVSNIDQSISQVTVRLSDSPDRLNPILSKTSEATQIENLILISASEYDPERLELTPVLIEAVPTGTSINEGEYSGKTLYSMRFKSDALWEDGSAVTAADYVFTLKIVFNPFVKASWRNLLSDIEKVYYDESEPLSVATVTKSGLMHGPATVSNFNIYPAYAYDPSGMMSQVSLEDLLTMDEEALAKKYPDLQKFAKQFLSDRYSREVVTGAGPYTMESWENDFSIVLKEKSDYWGDKHVAQSNYFKSGPESIQYRVIPDENTAVSALRDGKIDIMSRVDALNFAQLQNDGLDNLEFHTPQLMRYFYIAMNSKDLRLEENGVRQAMAHLLDVDELIDQLLGGLARRTVGPIHPSKSYYASSLTPIAYNTDKAISLLKSAGWKDTDGDGVRDKMKNGKKEKLSFTLKTTPKELGRNIGLVLQENAKDAGVEIEIISKEFRSILGDIGKGDFHFANLVSSQYPGNYDPYSAWHTDNIGGGGRNYLGFGNEETDALIAEIRSAESEADRRTAYLKFQEIIYESQPAIFLFSPVERIVCNADYNLVVSGQKPGYFENTVSRKK